ncbi:MAG: flap endonuclease-1 [Methanosarcinales archaeon Met12]|nr:MAG: flap endonuclease-1 [Methanosarcinales archaeon Met12]
MGVDFGDMVERQEISLKDLFGKAIAIDAYNAIYQFLSIIRQPDGTPLMNSRGEITSHLSGLLYRNTNLIEGGLKPIFVFDGEPSKLKTRTIQERNEVRIAAERLWAEAKKAGSAEAIKFAQASSKIDTQIVDGAKTLLRHMGIPCIQAPSEGEAQAAFMAINGDAYAVGSQDYDAILVGAPILIRNLAITGRRKLPGKNVYIDVNPENVELDSILSTLEITREQLVDIAILIGTDYDPGVKGVGPKTALKLIKKHGAIEGALAELGADIENFDAIRDVFLHPDVASDYEVKWREPDENEVESFLCGRHDFSEDRVRKALERLVDASDRRQRTLDQWF